MTLIDIVLFVMTWSILCSIFAVIIYKIGIKTKKQIVPTSKSSSLRAHQSRIISSKNAPLVTDLLTKHLNDIQKDHQNDNLTFTTQYSTDLTSWSVLIIWSWDGPTDTIWLSFQNIDSISHSPHTDSPIQ